MKKRSKIEKGCQLARMAVFKVLLPPKEAEGHNHNLVGTRLISGSFCIFIRLITYPFFKNTEISKIITKLIINKK